MNTSTNNSSTEESTELRISVDGKITRFDYDDLKTFHQGDSWFGCSVGFRAMQLAARELSVERIWSREALSVISGHPGPGVKDAIELITAAVSSGSYQLLDNTGTQQCNRNMKFEWWVSNNHQCIHIYLLTGIIPESFFILLDKINADSKNINKGSEYRVRFDQMKAELSKTLWQRPLDNCFGFDLMAVSPTQKHTNSEVTLSC